MVSPTLKLQFVASKFWCATMFSSLEIYGMATAHRYSSNGYTTRLHVCNAVFCNLWNGITNPLWIFCILLSFYRCYIDDCFGIWTHHIGPEIDDANWLSLKVAIQAYGSLELEFTERRKSADFLDLNISFKSNGTFKTKLLEKKINL